MTEVEKLQNRLKEIGATQFSVFPGSDPNVTSEEIAKEINDSLDRLMAGELEEISFDEPHQSEKD